MGRPGSRERAVNGAFRALADVIHHLQCERTASVASLEPQITVAEVGDKALTARRAETSENLIGLPDRLAEAATWFRGRGKEPVAVATARFATLERLRNAVDLGELDADRVITSYSELVHDLLQAVGRAGWDDVETLHQRGQLVATTALLWAKELASIERVVLGRAVALDRFEPTTIAWIVALISGQESLLRVFDQTTSPRLRVEMAALQQHPASVGSERLEREALANGVSGLGIDLERWNGLADERTDLLRALELRQLDELEVAANPRRASDTTHAAGIREALEATMPALGEVRSIIDDAHRGELSLREILRGRRDRLRQAGERLALARGVPSDLAVLSVTDPLTSLPNRSRVTDLIADAQGRSAPNAPVAVFALDVDHFKVVNDSLGHDVGDLLLRSIAERLQRATRTHDVLARLGGDEFVVIAEAVPGPTGVRTIGERLLRIVAEPHDLGGHTVTTSVSIGAALDDGQRDPAKLLRDSDTAVHRAKELGRGRLELFETGLRTGAVLRHQLHQGLRQALDLQEIEPWFQPIVDTRSGIAVTVEALARWRTADAVKPASAFIDAAEEAGLLPAIGEVMLVEGFRRRPRSASGVPAVSVNFAAAHLTQVGLPEDIARTLDQLGADPSELWVEVTEQTAVSMPRARTNLAALRDLGCTIALDDFGTGFSALAALRELPIDVVKLDGSFVSDLGDNFETYVIVESVLRIATTLGLRVVAEGVERPAQLDALREMGCDMVQGYGLAKPAPTPNLDGLLRRNHPTPAGPVPEGRDAGQVAPYA